MSRKPTQLLVLFAFFCALLAAALMGCGNSATSNPPDQPVQADAQVDQDAATQDVLPPQPDADATVPETGTDADAGQDVANEDGQSCTKAVKACEACPVEGQICGDYICSDGNWVDDTDSGVVSAECPKKDAGDADSAVPETGTDADSAAPDADAATEAETSVPEAGVDADAAVEAETTVPEAGVDADAAVEAEASVTCINLSDCTKPECSQLLICQPEICDGIDNNGNGQIDENFPCIGGSSKDCVTSCNTIGKQLCGIPSCTYGACVPPVEICFDKADNNCDGKIDCADPACANIPACKCVNAIPGNSCAAYPIGTWSCNNTWRCNCGQDWDDPLNSGGFNCMSEVCDGVDNDGNGQTDETFACVKGSAPINCTTTCGSTGTSACLNDCSRGACAPPAENCSVTTDNDCDGFAGCWDSDCFAATACQHDYGTCQPFTPTNQPYTCGTWQQDVVPDGMYLVKSGCANSQNDQWVVGCNYYDKGYAYHLSGGTTWTDTSIPVPTDCLMDVACQGATSTYAIGGKEHYGVLLKWNGSAWQQVASDPAEFVAMWAFSPTNIWIYARSDYGLLNGAQIMVWDGNSLTKRTLPQLYAPMTFHITYAHGIWASGPNDVYLSGNTYDPNDRNNYDKNAGAIMHFDGTSWGKVQIANTEKLGFSGIHGSSSCDVLAVGIYRSSPGVTQGATFQRNGNTWQLKTYANLEHVASVVKVAPFKYVLQGGQTSQQSVFIGTDQGSWSVNWSQNYQCVTPNGHLEHDGATWHVPGTDVNMMAGDGELTPAKAMFFRSTCQ